MAIRNPTGLPEGLEMPKPHSCEQRGYVVIHKPVDLLVEVYAPASSRDESEWQLRTIVLPSHNHHKRTTNARIPMKLENETFMSLQISLEG